MEDTSFDFSEATNPFGDAVNPFADNGAAGQAKPTTTKDLLGTAREQLVKADEVPDYNMLRGTVERGGQLMGGMFRAGDALSKGLEDALPMGGLVWEDGIIPKYYGADEYKAVMAESGAREPLDIAADHWKESDAGYQPNHTWEKVKEEFSDDPLSGSAWGEVAMYAAEQGVKSLPDMAAALLNLPAYITSRSGEMGEARAQNKGKDTTELTDVLEAMPFAVASAALERVGAKGITDAAKEQIGKEMLKAGFAHATKRVATAGGKAAGKEALTEFIQEGMLEYVGERIGTDAKMTLAESFDQGLAGAVAGGGYGGAGGMAAGVGRERSISLQREAVQRKADVAEADAMGEVLGEFANANDPFNTAPKALPGTVTEPEVPEFEIPQNDTMTVDRAGNVDPQGRVNGGPASKVPPKKAEDKTHYQWYQQANNAGESQTVLVDNQTGEILGHHGERLRVDPETQAKEYDAKIKDMIDTTAAQREAAIPDHVPVRTEPFAPPVRQPKPTIEEIDVAAAETNTAPSEAQIEADNYKKGRTRINGFDIAFENPKGSVRSGVDEKGKAWESTMAHHYGDIKGHKGADGDDLDVFVGDKPESEKVFVIDQVNPKTGQFDEHKVMMGFDSLEEAHTGYLANYEENWQGLGEITELHESDFKDWVKKGDTTKPYALKPTSKKTVKATDKSEGVAPVNAGAAEVKPTDTNEVKPTVSASGKAFASEKSAKASIRANIRNRKLKGQFEDYQVVPVAGGFGYQPLGKLEDELADLASDESTADIAVSESLPETPPVETDKETPVQSQVARSYEAHGVSVSVPNVDRSVVDDYNRATHLGKGRDFNEELRSDAERLLGELAEKKHTLDTDEQKSEAKRLVESYLEDAADFMRWNSQQAVNNPSWMVTGRSGRDMDKYNRKQERHGEQYQARAKKIESQRDSIAKTLYEMRPDAVKESQSFKAGVNEIARVIGGVAGYVQEGKNALAADARKWAAPKVHKILEKNLLADPEGLVAELKKMDSSKAMEPLGGLVKVIGPRSKAGKLLNELLGSESEQVTDAPPADDVPSDLKLKPNDFVEDSSLKNLKAGPYPLQYHNAIFKAAREGELDLNDFNAAFETLLANESEIKSRLNTYKKANLMGMSGRYYIRDDFKKPQVLEHVWERMLDNYLLDRDAPQEGAYDVFSLTEEKRQKRKDDMRTQLIEIVRGTTQEDIDSYVQGFEERKAEQESQQKAEDKALKDPQTLEEFRTFIQKKSEADLSGAQLTAYDALVTDQVFKNRAEAQSRKAEVKAVAGDVSYDLTETKHTKTDEDLFVVRMTGERLDKEAFSELRSKAKLLGGYYSSYRGKGAVPGFQFKSEEDRQKFVNVLQGENESSLEKQEERQEQKKDARITKLLDLADRAETRAQEVLNQDRKTNTARRASMAASVEARAEAEIGFARLLKEIAKATESGELKVLSNLSAATQLQELNYLQSRLVWDASEDLVTRNDLGARGWKSDVSIDDQVKFAKMPTPKVHVRTLRYAAEGMAKVDGFKQTAKGIESRIKGANADAMIDLGHYQWDRLLPKIKKFASLPGGIFNTKGQSDADTIKEEVLSTGRLEALGITSLPELRTALRELYQVDAKVSGVSSEKTKLQKLERDLKMTVLNNRKAFNDFFPTTETIANDVVEMADIEPGMTVLEPSAGNAMLADAAQEAGGTVEVSELAGPLREILAEKGYTLVGSDFLEMQTDKQYDRVVMNPPFSKDQDIQHVAHAYNMLKPGGRLVAIVSSMAGERQNKRNKRFREWLDSLAVDEQMLPEGAFKSSLNATAVRTKVIVIDKPEGDSTAPDFSAEASTAKSKVESVTVFSTGQSGKGVDAAKVKQRIARKVLSWEKGPVVEVVQTVQQLPDHIQQQIKARNVQSPHGARDGYDGTVYIVAGNLRNLPHADRILAHEAVGHYAMEKMLGDEFDGVLNKVQYLKETDPRIKKIAAQVQGEGNPDIESAEIIAKLAEQDIKHPVLIKAYAALRKFLKKLRFDIQFGLPELKAMLVDAAEYLRTGKRSEYGESESEGAYESSAAAFSQEPDTKKSSLFSGTKEGAVLEEIQHYGNETADKLVKLWKKNWTADLRPAWLGALTRRHMADIAGKALPQIKRYVRIAQEMDARRNELLTEGANLTDRWTKYNLTNRKEAQELAELMHDATVAGVDPSVKHKVLITKAEVEKLREKNAVLIKERSHDGAGGGKTGIRSQTHLRKEVEAAEMKLAQERNRVKARPLLESRWNALSPEAQAIFVEVRDAYKQRQQMTLEAVEARIGRSIVDGQQAKNLVNSLREEYESVTVEDPYFPLARFGKYWVDARLGDSDRVFEMFETTAEQEAYIEKMRNKGYRIRHGAKLDDLKQLDGVSAKFVTEVETMLTEQLGDWPKVEAIKDDIYQMYLQSMPDLSVRKNFIHRKKVKGYAKDALRAYADSMFHGSYQLARLEHSDLLLAELDEMRDGLDADLDRVNEDLSVHKSAEGMIDLPLQSLRSLHKEYSEKATHDDADKETEQRLNAIKLALKHRESPKKLESEIAQLERTKNAAKNIGKDRVKATHLYNEMLKRHEWAMNPKGAAWANDASSIGFTWYLGVSPAAALVNVTQTPMVAYPMLAAKFGWKESADALMNASNDYFAGGFGVEGKLSGDRLKAYREAVRTGVIDKTLAHDLASVSEEGSTYNPVRHTVMKGVSFLFHNAERYNREITFMAAYDLARKKGGRHETAIDYAHEFTWDSHFDYSSGNKARFMQGDVAKVLLMFRQFSLNMTYLLARNAQQALKGETKENRSLARRQLSGILGMHFIFAGAMGMPLWSVLGGTLNAVFDDEDEPWDFDTEFRNFLVDAFGFLPEPIAKKIGHAVAHGPVQAITGQGISSRVSLNNLWLRESNKELEGRDQVQYWFEQLLGPMGGIALSQGTAYDLWKDGHNWRALESAVPKFVKDGLKGVRYWDEGVNNLRGDSLIEELSFDKLIAQGLGLTPAQISERYEANNAIKKPEQRLKRRSQNLINHFALAYRTQDTEDLRKIKRAIIRFNNKNPRMRIMPYQLVGSLRRRSKYSNDQIRGIVVDRKLRYLTENGRFAE